MDLSFHQFNKNTPKSIQYILWKIVLKLLLSLAPPPESFISLSLFQLCLLHLVTGLSRWSVYCATHMYLLHGVQSPSFKEALLLWGYFIGLALKWQYRVAATMPWFPSWWGHSHLESCLEHGSTNVTGTDYTMQFWWQGAQISHPTALLDCDLNTSTLPAKKLHRSWNQDFPKAKGGETPCLPDQLVLKTLPWDFNWTHWKTNPQKAKMKLGHALNRSSG